MDQMELAQRLQPGRTEVIEGVLYVDASALTVWQGCRRKWYMGSWLSWEPSERPLDARDKGSAWGRAMDVVWTQPSASLEQIQEALGGDHADLLQSVLEYRQEAGEWMSQFQQVEAEHFFLHPLSPQIVLFGWMDKVTTDASGRIWGIEHKTGGKNSSVGTIFQQHRHTLQIGLYTLHGVQQWGERFGGVVVDAAHLTDRGNSFAHRLVDIFPEHLQMVQTELAALAEEVAQAVHSISSGTQSFRRSTDRCWDYFRECIFAAGCHNTHDLRTLKIPGGMQLRPRNDPADGKESE